MCLRLRNWIADSITAISIVALLVAPMCAGGCGEAAKREGVNTGKNELKLPAPKTSGGLALNELLSKRRSKRSFESSELTLEQLSQMLWAAQGITDREKGFRTAPSAGALYPLETYVLREHILQHYIPASHSLERTSRDIDAGELASAASGQAFIAKAPVIFVITGDFRKTESKYGDRAERFVCMEAGHAAQNLLLQATALGLGAVTVGAIDSARVKSILKLPEEQEPLYLIPVGYSTD